MGGEEPVSHGLSFPSLERVGVIVSRLNRFLFKRSAEMARVVEDAMHKVVELRRSFLKFSILRFPGLNLPTIPMRFTGVEELPVLYLESIRFILPSFDANSLRLLIRSYGRLKSRLMEYGILKLKFISPLTGEVISSSMEIVDPYLKFAPKIVESAFPQKISLPSSFMFSSYVGKLLSAEYFERRPQLGVEKAYSVIDFLKRSWRAKILIIYRFPLMPIRPSVTLPYRGLSWVISSYLYFLRGVVKEFGISTSSISAFFEKSSRSVASYSLMRPIGAVFPPTIFPSARPSQRMFARLPEFLARVVVERPSFAYVIPHGEIIPQVLSEVLKLPMIRIGVEGEWIWKSLAPRTALKLYRVIREFYAKWPRFFRGYLGARLLIGLPSEGIYTPSSFTLMPLGRLLLPPSLAEIYSRSPVFRFQPKVSVEGMIGLAAFQRGFTVVYIDFIESRVVLPSTIYRFSRLFASPFRLLMSGLKPIALSVSHGILGFKYEFNVIPKLPLEPKVPLPSPIPSYRTVFPYYPLTRTLSFISDYGLRLIGGVAAFPLALRGVAIKDLDSLVGLGFPFGTKVSAGVKPLSKPLVSVQRFPFFVGNFLFNLIGSRAFILRFPSYIFSFPFQFVRRDIVELAKFIPERYASGRLYVGRPIIPLTISSPVRMHEAIPMLSLMRAQAVRTKEPKVLRPVDITLKVESLRDERDLRELERKIAKILREAARRYGVVL